LSGVSALAFATFGTLSFASLVLGDAKREGSDERSDGGGEFEFHSD